MPTTAHRSRYAPLSVAETKRRAGASRSCRAWLGILGNHARRARHRMRCCFQTQALCAHTHTYIHACIRESILYIIYLFVDANTTGRNPPTCVRPKTKQPQQAHKHDRDRTGRHIYVGRWQRGEVIPKRVWIGGGGFTETGKRAPVCSISTGGFVDLYSILWYNAFSYYVYKIERTDGRRCVHAIAVCASAGPHRAAARPLRSRFSDLIIIPFFPYKCVLARVRPSVFARVCVCA